MSKTKVFGLRWKDVPLLMRLKDEPHLYDFTETILLVNVVHIQILASGNKSEESQPVPLSKALSLVVFLDLPSLKREIFYVFQSGDWHPRCINPGPFLQPGLTGL